jgi:hypothetical protein
MTGALSRKDQLQMNEELRIIKVAHARSDGVKSG